MDLKNLQKITKSKPSANKAGARQDAGPNSNEDFDSPYAGGLFGAGQVLSIDDFNKFASGTDSQGAYDNAATATAPRKHAKITKRQRAPIHLMRIFLLAMRAHHGITQAVATLM